MKPVKMDPHRNTACHIPNCTIIPVDELFILISELLIPVSKQLIPVSKLYIQVPVTVANCSSLISRVAGAGRSRGFLPGAGAEIFTRLQILLLLYKSTVLTIFCFYGT